MLDGAPTYQLVYYCKCNRKKWLHFTATISEREKFKIRYYPLDSCAQSVQTMTVLDFQEIRYRCEVIHINTKFIDINL
jgi:hypothetical protein